MSYARILGTFVFLLLMTASLNAQVIVDISFDMDDYAGHFEPLVDGVVREVISGEPTCLLVDSRVEVQALKPITVQPLKKYKLTIRAGIDAVDTVETNDRLPEIAAVSRGASFARCNLRFSDKNGSTVMFALYGNDRFEGTRQIEGQSIAILSKNMREYVSVFYAPPGADTLQLHLTPQQRVLRIEKMILEVEDAEGTVNCNPDFRYGELNLSGWTADSEGRLFPRADGTTVLKCGMAAMSSVFVVDDKSRYSFSCKGVGYDEKSGKVIVLFFDADGNELGHTHIFWDRDMEEGATRAGLRPLAGAKLAVLKASLVILEQVAVTADPPMPH